MVDWTQLIVPTLLSAVAVFVLSSLVHMVLKWHNPEYRRLPDEDAVCGALGTGLPPGQYIFPHCLEPKDMSPEMAKKFETGPLGLLYVRPPGGMQIGPFLAKWAVFLVIVSALVAYIARMALPPGADAMLVFRLTAMVTWLAYSCGGPADSIWSGKPWVVTIKFLVDGLAYGFATGAIFAWWWPA